MNFLSITIPQTRTTKLPPDSNTLWVTAISLGVDRLLTTLVTGAALLDKPNFRAQPCRVLPMTLLRSMTGVLSSQIENK